MEASKSSEWGNESTGSRATPMWADERNIGKRLMKAGAAICASVISFGAMEADAHAFWQVWEDWEGATAPVYGGVNGGDSDINGGGAFSPTHYSLIGTLGTPAGWWSVGRYFTPPSGLACTAFAVYRGAGSFTTVQVKLEVINVPTWGYLHNGSLVNVSRNQGWTWRSGNFTSNGNEIFVRLVLPSQSGGSNVNVDDIVVECN
jgi:hypothetical protein